MADSRPRSHWPLVVLVLGLAALLAALLAWRSLSSAPAQAVRQTRELLEDARRIAEAFRSGTVTTSFASYATEVAGSRYLQFATLKQVEVFERKDQAALLWGHLALPDVVVEARAPVEYTYYLDLDAPWRFRLEGSTVLVEAPPIRWNAPAVDVSALRYEVRQGSVLRDEAAALEKLRQGLSELARRRAQDNVALVREVGRRKTEEFVEAWLRSRFSDAQAVRVRVSFPDEAPAPKPAG